MKFTITTTLENGSERQKDLVLKTSTIETASQLFNLLKKASEKYCLEELETILSRKNCVANEQDKEICKTEHRICEDCSFFR